MKKVTFLPQRKEVAVAPGTTLLQAAALAGVAVEGNCGGKGSCGKCKVKVVKGLHGEPSAAERKALSAAELAEGWVLACQREITGDTVVELQLSSDAFDRKTALTGAEARIKPEPALEKVALKLSQPSIKDQTPDLERLLRELRRPALTAGLGLISSLPQLMRRERFSVTAVLAEDRIIALEPGDTRGRMFGLAFDIGTTTLMGSLMDLHSGDLVAVAAATNPQNIFGADVISRITYASKSAENLAALQRKVIEAMNGLIRQLLKQSGVDQNEIYEAIAVGNTTMSHLFMGIDPTYLAPAPFVPVFQKAPPVEAARLGLAMNPSGLVQLLPNIAGYVGSDTVGVILAAELDRRSDTCLAVDIGTNGELVLAAKGRLLTCSTAAGPAFEGAQISCGMRAADGAIEAVKIEDDLQLKTIGDTAPRGICGSGLIDVAAALLKAGVIEPSGRFADPEAADGKLPPRLKERMRRSKGGAEIVLATAEQSATGKDVVLTQADLRELQLAKGAIYAGFKVLLRETGISEADVDSVLLAGAFGNYISVESALALGLLPDLPPEKIIPIGNAAGDGAKMALLSKLVRQRALELPEKVEHVELSSRQDFQEEFIRAISFQR